MGLCGSSEQVYAEEDKAAVLEEVRKKFAKYDTDNSGEIETSELGALIADVTGEKMTPLELQDAIRVLDTDGGGTVGWREFRAWFLSDEDDEAKVLALDQEDQEEMASRRMEEEAEEEAEAGEGAEAEAAVEAEEAAEEAEAAAEDDEDDGDAEAEAEAEAAARRKAAEEEAARTQLEEAARQIDSSDEEADGI
uniref:EF-hand domain-containing protein n=1 Tax=Bicosoecida sp. CB-2014 TaxID=1486930 RepID=A0A7S1C6V1_9STRA|mmetsp:Transcript_15831/g.55073  ORF Transcript_15831/g.55073 Transcript_15831/m.55073 type:complete len:194 (+) Transcript_15831:364-945(+)